MKIIPRGETSTALLSEEGTWVDRSELVAVDAEGKPAQLVPSSFNEPIELKATVTVEEYLDYIIKNVYLLKGEALDELAKFIRDKDIFTFTFNYRSDYDASPAFLIEQDGTVFMTIGEKAQFEYVGKDAAVTEALSLEDDEEEETEDDLDFGMM